MSEVQDEGECKLGTLSHQNNPSPHFSSNRQFVNRQCASLIAFPDFDADVAVESSNSSVVGEPIRRRHRRNRASVTQDDLEQFRAGYWGVTREAFRDIQAQREAQDQLPLLNAALANLAMSTPNNVNAPVTAAGSGPGFANLYESIPSNMPNIPRQNQAAPPASPAGSQNGVPGAMAGLATGMPMNAGQEMDLNYVYQMITELSELLAHNRDTTRNIIRASEEIARRAANEGTTPNLQQVNGEITSARIADLENEVAKQKRVIDVLKYEQVENMKLIAEYETAVGTMTEQIRTYCCNVNDHFLAQKRRYNGLLQEEKDAHLQSRLERDYWHAQTLRCAEMIRTAYRLRCEEEILPIRVVSGLQNEVRALRNALGLDPEKPEEEYGWEILKDTPPGVDYGTGSILSEMHTLLLSVQWRRFKVYATSSRYPWSMIGRR
ncbi:conserved hypothetical protein [Uncinocarpus reesii 1704]|uniref:Uncharacterized protein n=1 Tax=Uncinocarpus reesii (strain UAMH 1704) TaxID=336963 RepID=C4JNX2_UNCRE|nr:uncharacterized protein UREG_04442 [Uncinocarpus reesii 1704]EEP79596.1 conserved hypothetical protein [Uncinocarpus reesii 1704]